LSSNEVNPVEKGPTHKPPRARRLALSFLRIILAVIVGLSIFLFFFQSHYIYRPVKEMIITPDKIGLDFEDVTFKASDGTSLKGWYIPLPEDRGTVLYLHSNAGNISYYLDTVQVHRELRLSTFLFDYRGYGLSQGRPQEEGTYLDALAAWDYLVNDKGLPPERIIIHGHSLGGAIASYLATQRNPRILIIESSFTSFPDIARDYYPYLPISLIARYDYPVTDYVQVTRCPVLVIHSKDDEIISPNHGKLVFAAANEPKAFLSITGTHNEGFMTSGKTYTQGLNDFIDRHYGK